MVDGRAPNRERGPISNNEYTIAPAVPLSTLDPTADPSRFDALVLAITADAMRSHHPNTRLGARHVDVFATLATFSPATMLAAAAVVLIASASFVVRPLALVPAPGSMVESAGIPAPLVGWTIARQTPSATDLIDLFDREAMSGLQQQ